MLTVYRKDLKDDYGLRLDGVVAFARCLLALLFFNRLKEAKTPVR